MKRLITAQQPKNGNDSSISSANATVRRCFTGCGAHPPATAKAYFSGRCPAALSTFALLYASLGLISPRSDWFDPFYFSVVTFTTLGYGDVHPVGILGKMVASAESMAGLVMFGILLTFIGNRVQRT
ncbi:MAG: potassium channel family protein [Thermoanaerobaculia bacterium]